jgi:hypothetical protein
VGEVPGIAAREVDETGSGDHRGQLGALGILPVEHLECHRLDTHGRVVCSAKFDPVSDPVRTIFGGGCREEDCALGASREQFGVDGDHHLEELSTSYQCHRPRQIGAPHGLGPNRVGIRLTLVVW